MDMYLPSTPTIAANLHASQTLVHPFLLGALLSPLSSLPSPPIGGQGAATVAGIMIGTLCLGGLISQLIITRKR